ncbi:MAG: hypothetical protein FWH01_18045, partial [Oscillospiraceae bacterium]|nr:hypothetical protein [Oscillospiraceae bacterium]
MPVLKLNISYEDHLKLKEASEFYGVPIQELYRKMADDYIAKIREIDDENKKATLSERIRGKRIDMIAAIAY